jgi:hypothetical protein
MKARPSHRSRHLKKLHPIGFTILAVVFFLLPSGCSERHKSTWRHQSRSENLHLALEDEHPDVRRDAVIRIGKSRYVDSEEAYQVLDAVARTDPADQVRCVAIRSFARYDDPRPVEPLLSILSATDTTGNAIPASDTVRWDTTTTLVELEEKGLIHGDQRDEVMRQLISLLASDSFRNVRLTAAAGLGSFQDRAVFPPLIEALRDPDFAIADQAERSLIRLTGTTHNYDPDEWNAWLAQQNDPFANAGHEPPTTRPPGPSWWDKQKRAFRRALKLGNTD